MPSLLQQYKKEKDPQKKQVLKDKLIALHRTFVHTDDPVNMRKGAIPDSNKPKL